MTSSVQSRAPSIAPRRATDDDGVPMIWPRLVAGFGRYVEHYLKRHFNGVRLSRSGFDPRGLRGPLVIYLNHPSWWDPLVGMLLARRLFAGHRHYAPIDALALNRYRFFSRLGFFGVERASPQAGARFIRTSRAILSDPQPALWITAQGEFTDVRRRPVTLRGGIGHLAARMPELTILPLAIEYAFWQERLPEVLVRFGEPIVGDVLPGRRATAWTDLLANTLEETLDVLSREAQDRQPRDFECLLSGKTGVGFVYDNWRRVRSWLGGAHFSPAHAGPENIS